MTEIKRDGNNFLLVNNDRVFLQSKKINIFPCSRRGSSALDSVKYYDPEARLNTERTNRLHTAVNGFKDSFVINFNEANNTLIFVLKGYYIEIKDFNPSNIAKYLGTENVEATKLYAHLSLHDGISLNVEDYATEILYRQFSKDQDKNYLDITYSYSGTGDKSITEDFFVGISFTNKEGEIDSISITNTDPNTSGPSSDRTLAGYDLLLFNKSGNTWELEQTSLLPKVEHGEAENSIIVGKVRVNETLQVDSAIIVGTPETNNVTTIDENISTTGHLTVNKYLNIGTPTNATTTVGDIVAANDIKAEGDISANGTLSVPDAFTAGSEKVTINALLGVTHDASFEGVVEITGNAVIESNLVVEDNINVGDLTREEKAMADNGGYIIAKKDIIAKNDLKAGNNISAGGSVDVTENLKVTGDTIVNKITSTGEEVAIDKVLKVDTISSNSTECLTINQNTTLSVEGGADINDLTVDTNIDTNTLTANTSISTPEANVSGTLTVTNANHDAEAKVDTLIAGVTTVNDTLTAKEIWLKDLGQIPVLELAHLSNNTTDTTDDSYQLRFKFGSKPIKIIEE